MLRRSCGLCVSQAFRNDTRIPLQRRFHNNLLIYDGQTIAYRDFPRQLSSVTGSSFLRFQDPWIRWSRKQLRLMPSEDDDESKSKSSTTWIAISPASLVAPQRGILDRIISWLRICWKTISRLSFLVVRTSEVVVYLSPVIILAPAAYFSHRILDNSTVSNIAWQYTIKAIQGLGPVAVKFCQWAATRRDIFHPALCDRLSILHDSGYPHSQQWTHQVLTEAFGNYEQKGLVIDEVIGCGAAAQVYRGKLTSVSTDSQKQQSTREVAIKVLHPRFQEMVDRDLDFIEIVTSFLHSLPIEYLRMLNLPRAVEEFSILLRDQVDLATEADNLRQFRKNFYKDSQQNTEFSSIIFPQPIEDWTSSHVIVEEYIPDAVPIADFLLDSSHDGMDIRKELAAPLLRAFFKMVFIDNFIHGDLHPVSEI